MANNPKKVKDPTEVALSAIQEALNIGEQRPAQGAERDAANRVEFSASEPSAASATFDDRSYETRTVERAFEAAPEDNRFARRPANDDREAIGQILQSLQKSRPGRTAYTIATLFAGIWIAGCGLLTVAFLPSGLTDAIIFSLLFAILLFRPHGLLGKPEAGAMRGR